MKILKGVFIFLAIVILGFVLYVEFYAESHLQNYLPPKFKDQYHFEYDNFDVNYFSVGFTLEKAKITPDSIRGDSSNASIGQVEKIVVAGINLWAIIFNNRLFIRKVNIEKPLVHYHPSPNKKDTGKTAQSNNSKGLKSVSIKSIELNQGSFSYYRSNKDSASAQVPNIELQGSGLGFNLKDSINRYEVDDLQATISDSWFYTKNEMYRLGVDNIILDWQESSLQLDSFKLLPRLPKYEFSRKTGHQTDRMEARIEQIIFNQLDYDRILETNEYFTRHIIIENMNLDILRDRRLPKTSGNQKLPSQLLSELQKSIQIDSMHLNNGQIRFSEFVAGGHAPGQISFENLQVQLHNITTLSSNKNKASKIKATTSFMGAADLDAEFTYPQGFQNDTFQVTGKLHEMALSEINPMVEDVAFVMIKSGYNQSMEFDFSANANYASGAMEFYYDNLNVQLMNKDVEKDPGVIKNSLSSFINNFVIKKSNPSEGSFRTGHIYFNRAETGKKFLFNYWWKSLFTGIKESVGVNPKESK